MGVHVCYFTRNFWRPSAYSFLLTMLLLSMSGSAVADEIYFKSGASHTGVIIRETKDSLTFKTELGVSTVNREKVNFIEKATPEENKLLLKKWREQEQKLKDAQEARHETEINYEAEQRAKGMVEFEGKWVIPQEKDRILELRRQAAEDRKKFDEEQQAEGLVRYQYLWVTRANAEELRKMEPEIYRLYENITNWKKTADSFRSGMTKVGTLDEADSLGKRIAELDQQIDEATKRLGELLQRADEIEAVSVRYVTPEKYREALSSGAESN